MAQVLPMEKKSNQPEEGFIRINNGLMDAVLPLDFLNVSCWYCWRLSARHTATTKSLTTCLHNRLARYATWLEIMLPKC